MCIKKKHTKEGVFRTKHRKKRTMESNKRKLGITKNRTRSRSMGNI